MNQKKEEIPSKSPQGLEWDDFQEMKKKILNETIWKENIKWKQFEKKILNVTIWKENIKWNNLKRKY